MKAIMVMFDSLNRHMLPPYGCDWIHAPNFRRLAERTVRFDNHYVGSMPCIPARREMHTGRYNFLHTSWGPLEPFDDSMPAMLHRAGVYTHLVSDHYHYWEDGGATYHNRYSSWEAVRGQEGDFWKAAIREPEVPPSVDIFRHHGTPGPRPVRSVRHDWVNRAYMPTEGEQPQSRTFELGLDFIRENHSEDGWFLHVETFDPHEPFFTKEHYKDLYPDDYVGPHFDWPKAGPADRDPALRGHTRYQYAALVSMCDRNLGRVLDAMDRYDMWEDTMLIVNTDHGFLLGEHDLYGKRRMPWYNEIAHIPLFVWDPRAGVAGEARRSLTQTIDLAPTVLEFFDVPRSQRMQGHPLRPVIQNDATIREAALFGLFGGQVNCTDGRYVYMRGATDERNQPLFRHTLMPTHMAGFYDLDELASAELTQQFNFTRHSNVLKVPASEKPKELEYGTLLFDLTEDPGQEQPLNDPDVEERMIGLLRSRLEESEAPPEQYTRLGLE